VDGVLLLDAMRGGWPVLAADAGASGLSGFREDELRGRGWPPLWEPSRPEVSALADAVRERRAATVELPTLRARGADPVPSLVSVRTLDAGAGAIAVCTIALQPADVRRLAFYDALTGLANRNLLERDLDLALSRALRNGTRLALLFVDLDDFKAVNDALGHGAGDAVLAEVAARLREAVRAHDLVARLGGDEFVLVLTDLDADAQRRARTVAAHVSAALAAPIVVAGTACRVGASIGISEYPADGADGEALLAMADGRMYDDKREGRFRRRRVDVSVELDRVVERAARERERFEETRRALEDARATARRARADLEARRFRRA
jgi:diguanylate cyclase (GGDEF)-like protein